MQSANHTGKNHPLRDIFLYAGLSKEDVQSIKKEVEKSDMSSLRLYTMLCVLFFSAAFIVAYVAPSMQAMQPYYCACALMGLFCLLLEFFVVEKHPRTLLSVEIIFLVFLLFVPATMQLFGTPFEKGVVLPALFALVPLLFAMPPVCLIIIQNSILIYYIVGTILLRPREIITIEIVNAVTFSAIGIIIGVYTTRLKLERHLYEQNALSLMRLRSRDALTDQLTGLKNRRACYEESGSAAECDDLIVVSADINGLKKTNDTFGHKEGDRLIRGAASLLDGTFGHAGTVYRVGGDEFQLLLHGDESVMETLLAQLREQEQKWNESDSINMNISIGYVLRSAYPDKPIEALCHLADQKMYREKNLWYRQSGHDRRANR